MAMVSLLFIISLSLNIDKCLPATEINEIGSGALAAFGDFNADKHTDIFVIADEGTVTVSGL